MTCHEVQNVLSLYLYGELDFAREEAVEQHVADCAFCMHALGREKAWHASLQGENQDVSLDLLSRCRRDLTASLSLEKANAPARIPAWRSLLNWFDLSGLRWSSKLAYASFLVLLGFGAGRAAKDGILPDAGSRNVNIAGFLGGNTRVRDLQPGQDGQVRLFLESVREGEMLVSPDDPQVRALLVAATRDPENAAVRVQSVQILTGRDGADVKDALIYSVRHDPNAAVRLKAVEALRHFSGDPATRDTLKHALQHDGDPSVRSEAIDVLAPEGDRINFTPDLVNMLRSLAVPGEDDDYVRLRSRQLLQGMAPAENDTY
ncbi:MAG: putative transrane anti-sigma factor [Bryobacterales bacterium]|nr:putative transrane anti-sigma factor [Bryobacterales bacterium]